MTRDQKSAKLSIWEKEIHLDLQFEDFEQYRVAAQGLGLDFVQLDKGPFRGFLRQASVDNVFVSHFNFNRHFHQQGAINTFGRTFGLFFRESSPMKWLNNSFGTNSLAVFPTDGTFEATSYPGFDALSITIRHGFLEDISELHELSEAYQAMPKFGALYELQPDISRQLRLVAGKYLDQSTRCNDSWLSEELEFEIARLILTVFSLRKPNRAPANFRKRDRAYSAAIELTREMSDKPMTVPELCKSVGASERTLRYAFQERLGVSPKQYINSYRLREVRRVLLSAPQDELIIQDIAAQYGYWHSGQFAADYRAMFGEYPSETLSHTTN